LILLIFSNECTWLEESLYHSTLIIFDEANHETLILTLHNPKDRILVIHCFSFVIFSLCHILNFQCFNKEKLAITLKVKKQISLLLYIYIIIYLFILIIYILM
jgi:hypothetical protein